MQIELPRKSGLWKSCGLQDTGREDQKKMQFVGSLMELKYIAEGGSVDLGGQKRKLAIEIITKLCLFDAEKRNVWEQELVICQELKKCFSKAD